ncbi:hypothetical protein FIBSPDRAFT_144635 [Athelia psychrophila]|uniref:Uncharacterized protein n=1 Tax=Athelia psychrophila TaxID=1759441 RepID=A0A166T2V4_9AGAM|nr:hypothetical protein FIBSPDRAFT_144635 [Fibularhizoctonia sp. CBS 109695]
MSSTADANSYPSKRPRISVAPDINSFAVPATSKRVAYKPPAANFQSAFQTGEPKGPIDDGSSEKKKPKAFRTMKPPTLAFGLSGPSASPGNTPRKAAKKVGGHAVQLTSATTTSPTRPRVKPRSESSAVIHAARNPPPQPIASSSKLPAPPNIELKTKSRRPAPPPPVPMINVRAKPAVLKSLQAPKRQALGEELSPSKGLRTISTTHMARATDINSDGGAVSLFSISLQGREVADAEDGLETEMRRGIGLSPVKAGRNKARGFARYTRLA